MEHALEEKGEMNRGGRSVRRRNAYSVDMWRELKRHWMVLGVLGVVTMAVLAPRVGARGGLLHSELSELLPLCYVYYSAGRRTSVSVLWHNVRTHARLHAVCLAHAHLVAPALCAAILTALRDGLDYRIVKGVMLWSRGGGCAWLSLCLSAHATAPSVAALSYLSALLLAPLATALLCERAALPPWRTVLYTLCTTGAPFVGGLVGGALRRGAPVPSCGPALRLCALALLYAECCERLCAAAGVLRVSDVLLTLTLEVWLLCCVCATCALYARCGLLSASCARVVALCAVPRAIDTRWEGVGGCTSGLLSLPGVFVGPLQALLMVSLAPDDPPDNQHQQIIL